jgi:cytochrome P450
MSTSEAPPLETAPDGASRPMPRASWWETFREMLQYRDHTLALVSDLHRRHGPVVFQRTALAPLVSLFGPDANRFVLLNQQQALSAKRAWDLIMGRIFPNGLLLRDGDDHRHHRRIMQVAFHQNALREYVDRMNPHIAAVLASWDGSRGRVGGFLAFPAFKQLTLELACRIFLGIDLGGTAARLNEAFEATVAASMSFVRLRIPGLEFDRGLRGRAFMMDLFGGMISDKRTAPGADMFSRLCHAADEDGERYGDQEIVDHLIFLMMAAHDTTTSTLCSLLYELARHPEWQDRVRDECRAAPGDSLGYDELVRPGTLGRVIDETLRLHPPLSTIPRIATREIEFDGYRIPAGAMVAIYPLHTHWMPEWWSEPERFDPDRFAPGRAEHERHAYQFVPFGGGAHMCIGYRFAELQLKAILYQLARRYRWSIPGGYIMPERQAPIAKPRDGLPLQMERLA